MPQLHPDAFEDNVPGKYYIDKTCIDCGLCPQLAPAVFRPSDSETHSIAYRQPTTPDEVAQAEDAVAQCPSSSVRNDGEPVAASPLKADGTSA